MSNKNVIIVGASSSIGEAIVSRFHFSSCNIIATYFNNNPFNKDVINWKKLDLTDDNSIDKFIEFVEETFSNIDILVFLSGVIPGKSLHEYNEEDIEKTFSINFIGQTKVIKKLWPIFDQYTHIIMFSSISAQRGSYDPIYAASKGAILSFVKSFTNTRVRINAIAPGLIQDSKMYNDMTEERQNHHKENTISGELLKITDLADMIYDISDNHWKHLNGACIDLNGGQYVR